MNACRARSFTTSAPVGRSSTWRRASSSPGRSSKRRRSTVPELRLTPDASISPTRLAFTKMRRRCTAATNPSTRGGAPGPDGERTTSSRRPIATPRRRAAAGAPAGTRRSVPRRSCAHPRTLSESGDGLLGHPRPEAGGGDSHPPPAGGSRGPGAPVGLEQLSMRASSPRGSPVRAHDTWFGRWKSPTLTASASPRATMATSAAVQPPTPGTARRRRWAATAGSSTASSRRGATAATRRTVSARRRSTPKRWNTQYGVAASGRAGRHEAGRVAGGTGRPLPEPAHQPGVGAAGFLAEDLLLEDGRHRGLHHGLRAGDTEARQPPVQRAQQRVLGSELVTGVVTPDQLGRGVRGLTPPPGPTTRTSVPRR